MLDFSRISHTYDQDGRQVETIRHFDLSVMEGEFLTMWQIHIAPYGRWLFTAYRW
jgi:hypothetical protein